MFQDLGQWSGDERKSWWATSGVFSLPDLARRLPSFTIVPTPLIESLEQASLELVLEFLTIDKNNFCTLGFITSVVSIFKSHSLINLLSWNIIHVRAYGQVIKEVW